ncbi:MAG: hypothetical protein FJ109_18175 [Deltaproteobacteria bacterium]|nr:hypothetical protein [Deltaproteobacteria bacterium]
MHLAIVNGERLTEALRRMAGAGAGHMGGAIWRIFYTLEIEWAGMCEELPAEVLEPMTQGLLVANDVMHHVCGRFSYSGPTPLTLAEGKLGIGRDLVPVTLVDGPRESQLPMDATEADLLRKMLTEPMEVIRRAGYTSECDDVAERWRTTVAAAHKELAWTGVDERTLEAVLAQVVRKRGKVRAPRDGEGPGRMDQPRCALFFSDSVIFNTSAYHEPLSLLLAMLGEILSDPVERTNEIASLVPILSDYPKGAAVLAGYVAAQKHVSPELLHALFSLALEINAAGEVEPWLEKAVTQGMDRKLLVALLEQRARSARKIQLRAAAHTWETLPKWLRVVLPYVHPSPPDWLRWVLLEIGPHLANVPESVAYKVAFALSEAIFGIDPDEVGDVQLMLEKHGEQAALLASDPILRDALDRKLGFFAADAE